MARTINEIRDGILANVAADPVLAPLNSVSATAIFRLIIYCVAVAINIMERNMEATRDKTFELLGTQRLHGAQYYIDMAKAFQFSDTTVQAIVFNDYYVPSFEVPNEDLRIVSSVAIREANRKIFMKVNKGEPGALQVLTAPELQSFKNYIHLLKDMGTQIDVQSLPAEKLRVRMSIDYNQVYGSLSQENVQTLINNYLVQMGYDNRFSVQGFEAALLADSRIFDLRIESIYSFYENGTQAAEIFNLSRGINLKTYLTTTGHMNLDVAGSSFALYANI